MKIMEKSKLLSLLEHLKVKLYVFRPILRPFYKLFIAKKQLELRNEVFLKNAIDVLETFDKAMKTGGYPYTLAFGSLLGAVREKGFIKHDLDIDTAMWADDYDDRLQETLRDFGFERIHSYTVDKGASAREETYEKNGVSIDIFFFYPPINKYPYCCDFLNHQGKESLVDSVKRYSSKMIVRRIELPMTKKITLAQFDRLKLPIPAESHNILLFRYGHDYMIPNEHWSIATSYNEHIIVWEGKTVEAE